MTFLIIALWAFGIYLILSMFIAPSKIGKHRPPMTSLDATITMILGFIVGGLMITAAVNLA